MAGKKPTKRAHAVAMRCAKLRRDGMPLGAISEATGVDRSKVSARIELGERLLSLTSG